MRRVAVIAAVLLGGALVVEAGISARSGAKRSPATCRGWVTAPAFRRQIAQVRPLVARMKRALAAPGLAVAIAVRGRIVWAQGCGFANVAREAPVARTTLFRIGSVSKTLTAAAAARLYQQGRLEIDAAVQRYVPSFPRKGAPITLRQLGGHLAGIRHYEGDEALSTKHYRSLTETLAVFEDDPLVAPPGVRFSYSSYGFNLLGAALEGAAGKRFSAVISETILQPLGLTHTHLDDGRATGRTALYEVTAARTAVPAPRVDLSNRYPSGGFLSTAEDLARLGTGLSDARFVDARRQGLLFTSQRTRGGEKTGYGFGFEVQGSPLGRFAGHTGNVVGGTAFLLVHPKTGVAVALTTNIGFVTSPSPPPIGRDVPTPPDLAVPFVLAVTRRR